MSAAGRSAAAETGHVRHADDFYATPAWCTRSIFPWLARSERMLDPCAGTGAILKVATEFWGSRCFGIEINHVSCVFARQLLSLDVRHADALDPQTFWGECAVVTNPPYSLAMPFVERALANAHGAHEVAMLLRLNWLAGQKRAAFHRAHPCDVYVLPKRPSFTPDGRTDATEYAWMVWGPGRGGRWSVLELP